MLSVHGKTQMKERCLLALCAPAMNSLYTTIHIKFCHNFACLFHLSSTIFRHLVESETSLSCISSKERIRDMYVRLCGMQLAALQAAADIMHAVVQLWQHGPASEAVDY